ncbi:hypothetical protein LPJ55_001905 [Coemansia sp. RSA 990]|nr:hypothetical protein LPJ55_001905 [Coemansia sp. RSA 990]
MRHPTVYLLDKLFEPGKMYIMPPDICYVVVLLYRVVGDTTTIGITIGADITIAVAAGVTTTCADCV